MSHLKKTQISDIVVPDNGWYMVSVAEVDIRPRKKKATISFVIENNERFRGLEVRLSIMFNNKKDGIELSNQLFKAAGIKTNGRPITELFDELCVDKSLYVYAHRAYVLAEADGWRRVHFEEWLRYPNKKLIKVIVPPNEVCFSLDQPYGYGY